MSQLTAGEAPQRFYVFYFDDALEGAHAHRVVLDAGLPHRVQKYNESVYAGATSLGRGWGRIYVPEAEIENFMELTGNSLAPEPGLYVDGAGAGNPGCLGWLFGR